MWSYAAHRVYLTMWLTIMDSMLHLLLEHPERFLWSAIPCSLLGVWEQALDDQIEQPPDVHIPDISKPTPTSHQLSRCGAL